MGYSSRALCLAIWRLIVAQRPNDAMKTNTLYTTIHRISVEDPNIDTDWPMNFDEEYPQNNEVEENNQQNNIEKDDDTVIVDMQYEKEEKQDYDEDELPPDFLRNPSLDVRKDPNGYSRHSMKNPQKYIYKPPSPKPKLNQQNNQKSKPMDNQQNDEKYVDLPMEFYEDLDAQKVIVRPIKFIPPDEDGILQHIKNYGMINQFSQQKSQIGSNNVMFQKLLIIDHIAFPRPKIKQFLQKIKRLIENVKCKLLLVCHHQIEAAIGNVQRKDVSLAMKQRLFRINPISQKDAAKLLLESARQLFQFDFIGYDQPSTTEETSQFALFEWLSKSPSLIQQTVTVLDRKVPFCVILDHMKKDPSKWKDALREWKGKLRLEPDDAQDGINALTSLLTEINVVRSIWSDQQQ